MWECILSDIWFTDERERNISGAFALAVSDWAERMPTKRNIKLSVTPLRFAHMLCLPELRWDSLWVVGPRWSSSQDPSMWSVVGLLSI